MAEAERSQRAEAQGLTEQLRAEGDRRARVFNNAVKAAVAKIQNELEAERDSLEQRCGKDCSPLQFFSAYNIVNLILSLVPLFSSASLSVSLSPSLHLSLFCVLVFLGVIWPCVEGQKGRGGGGRERYRLHEVHTWVDMM